MAEIRPGEGSSSAHTSNILNYGHLGTATYLRNSQDWKFVRRTAVDGDPTDIDPELPSSNSAFPFRLVDNQIKTVISGNLKDSVDIVDSNLLSGGFNTFLKHLSDVVPGIPQIANHEVFTTSFADSTRSQRPNNSERLAFGSAVWLSENGHSIGALAPIAAVVAGPNAQSVSFVRIGREQVHLSSFEHGRRSLTVPRISTQDEAWWTGNGEPVQQICFAAAAGPPSAWMAVRQRSCTTILHPLLHRRPVPARYTPRATNPVHRPASLLDANPALTLPNSRTGSFPHADVAFHPQDHRKIAIVDEHGNWSIWRFEGSRANTFQIRLHHSGKIYSWEHTRRPPNIDPYYDGWHRVLWLGQSTHTIDRLLVCNRQTAAMYDVEGDFLGFVNMHMGIIREGQWILDIKKTAAHQGHCFVLTSTSLLAMSAADDDWAYPKGNTVMSTVFSWRHFRSRADSTMRLALVEAPQASTVFVYSKANFVVTAFRIGLDFTVPSVSVSMADPVQVALPRGEPVDGHESLDVEFVFRELQVRGAPNFLVDPQDKTLFKLFVQGSDLQVTEALFECTDTEMMTTLEIPYSTAIRLPVARALNQRSHKYAELDEVEDFIVEDAYVDGAGIEQEPYDEFLTVPKDMPIIRTGVTAHSQEIYDLIGFLDNRSAQEQRVEFVQNLRKFLSNFRNSRDSELRLHLLSQVIRAPYNITDVEEASEAFASFLQKISAEAGEEAVLSHLRAPYDLGVQVPTLFERYNCIFTAWVTSLPPQVPDRIRVNRERLARIVAADLTIASTAIRRDTALASHARGRTSRPEPVLHNSGFDELDLLPSLSRAAQEDTYISRLRNLTTISTAPSPIPTQILEELHAHMPTSIFTDPASYNWRSIEQTLIATRESQAAAQRDPKAQRRAEKRAEIQRRKLEAQKKISQALQEERERGAVPRVMDTQTQTRLPVREIQSSQLAPPSSSQNEPVWPTVSMTQPERGVFGTHSRTGVISGAKSRVKGKGKGKEMRRAGF